MGYTRRFADRMNLAAMMPRGSLTSSGYCLANPVVNGAEYLVYLPSGGSASLDLSATSKALKVEWFNPSTGQTTAAGRVTGGGTGVFIAPFRGDAVLYVYDPEGPVRPRAAPAGLPILLPAS
jgi:hypothetical protein